MKPQFSRLILALLIALSVFAVVRMRGLPTGGTAGPDASRKTDPQARKSPEPPGANGPDGVARAPGSTTDRGPGSRVLNPATRKPAAARSPLEIFAELFLQGEWGLSRGGDGRATGLRGTPIPGATSNAAAALGFARRLARELGVSPDQLSEAHSQSETDKGLQTIYKYEQWVGDYEVFSSSLTVLSRREDAAAYLVNSSLKPIDQAPGPGSLDRAGAEAAVLAQYRDRGGQISTPIYTSAYIYADQTPTELSWFFIVSVTSPVQTKLKVLFGASTQRVLYEGPALVN